MGLSRSAAKAIRDAVAGLFNRARTRLLGPRGPKRITFGVKTSPEKTLPGLYDAGVRSEGMEPTPALREAVLRAARGYLDAHERLAQTRVVHAVQSFLKGAETAGVKTDLPTVLGGELERVMGRVTSDVRRIVESEATKARNGGTVDAVMRVNAVLGVDDPVCYFVVVRDDKLCDECRRLHLMPDGTPRLWRLSEIGHGHHTRGDDSPKVGGLHPNCRCSLVTLTKGWGFDAGGRLKYIGRDHDELEAQRA